MAIHIQFNTADLTDEDRAVLAVLAGAPAAPSKPVAAPKAAAKAAAKPAPEPEEDDDEVDLSTGKTVEQALERASALVSAKKGKAVKAALTEVGAARVSEMDSEQIEKFFEILEGE